MSTLSLNAHGISIGTDGVFLEFHPGPDQALCDGPSCLALDSAAPLLATLKTLHTVVRDT